MAEPERDGVVGELAFVVDLAVKSLEPLELTTLAELGLKEDDLARWIVEHPEIVGNDLLLVTTEFDRWAIRGRRVADRLDLLFLDSRGRLVVTELKRDQANDTTELQALKYAAYCSTMTTAAVVEEYARVHRVGREEAEAAVLEHAPVLDAGGELGPIRIRLIAGSFGPSVTSVILFLRKQGIDVGCIEVVPRRLGDGQAVLTSRKLIPLPEAEDYVVEVRRREEETDRGGALRAYYVDFWAKFLVEARRRHPDWTKAQAPNPANWFEMPAPIRDGVISASFARRGRLRHELYLGGPDDERNLAILQTFRLRRGQFEQSYGREVEFEELPGKKACRIADYQDGIVTDVNRHGDFIDWFIDAGEGLRNALAAVPLTETDIETADTAQVSMPAG